MNVGPWRALGHHATDSDARVDAATVRRVWAFVRPHRGRVVALVAAVAVSAALGAIPPLLYRAIIDVAIAERRLGLLTGLAVAVLAVAIVSAAVQVVARWLSSSLGERVVFDVRVALFTHILRLPFAFFTRTHSGALISRLTGELQGGHRVFTETVATVAQTVLGVTVTVVAMLVLDWRLTLLALGIAPLFLLVTRHLRGRLHRLLRATADAQASLGALMGERFDVGGALLVKLLGDPERERQRFAAEAARLRDLGIRTAVVSRTFHVGFSLVAAVGIGLVYWVGGWLALSEGVTIGTLVAFTAYLSQLYAPLTMLANARVDLAGAMVAFERVFEVLDLPTPHRPGARRLDRIRGAVDFDGVWFRYPPAEAVTLPSLKAPGEQRAGGWVLKDVTLTVPPGRRIGVVGASGAGKTTLALLAAGIYDPTRGAVRIDGVDVRELDQETLRRAVGLVTQETHLFHDTVRNNLRYARPDATDAELEEACRIARIHDLIASLPDGYDTVVGERGYRFSGGEKQRLAIARLLLQDPAIVILDEATAHLDSAVEQAIWRTLEEVLEGRTSITIAHRLSTVRHADEIVVLEGGRIVERGTHEELLAADGRYAALYRAQQGRPAVGAGER